MRFPHKLLLIIMFSFYSSLARGEAPEQTCSDARESLFNAQLKSLGNIAELENSMGVLCSSGDTVKSGSSAAVPPILLHPGDKLPDGAEAYYNTGLLREQRGDIHGAIDAYEHCIFLNSTHIAAHQKLADIYYSKGKFTKAIREYRRLVEIAPKNSYSLIKLGRAYKKTGKLNEAAKSFEMAIQLAPSDIEPRRELIKLEIKRGNLSIAEKHSREALTINRDNQEERYRLIGILAREQKYDELVLFLGEEINRFPKESINYYRLGIVKELLKDFRSAIDAFQKSIAITPTANAYYALARTWLNVPDAKNAREALVQAKKIAPERQDINELLAILDKEYGANSTNTKTKR